MIIKKYIVNSMNEAVTRIRYELGKDAVIISQRKIRKKGFTGLFSKKVIEVTAAVDNVDKAAEITEGKFKIPHNSVKDSLEAIKKAMDVQMDNENSLGKLNSPVTSGKISKEAAYNIDKDEYKKEDNLIKEMREMKNILNAIVKNNGNENSNHNSELYKTLEKYDLEDNVIEEIINRINLENDEIEEMEKLKKVLGSMVEVSEINEEGVIVLVGPTGVGKTTTIAKLAGRFALIEKKKIGLITVDTYRIGAVEQLKTYADIMNIPFKVVFSIKDMEAAVESMRDCDVVLVDTTGRSSKNKMQISELRAFIDKTHSENLHLVMSCTTKNRDIKSIVEGYKILNYNNIIITKLDETTTYGSILNILKEGKRPLSYVSIGQNVPDDIKALKAEEVINLITGVESIC
ncbi:flagellar biosynthesis protein FlhF [Clostridium pasteurianum]|uniref:Flagellar biosynthesis protein FlhF n=1 Tax=Clostridium pasteurianum BC1 TaxID=86416 RepID=R4KB54_CLOPA|nr:flagellar biosynthesis protein FlhF [Clostridium pasteurianum]AGK97759.1 flagellar biosynthetic protein FlhF [Clostridium pasteurianum BC1]